MWSSHQPWFLMNLGEVAHHLPASTVRSKSVFFVSDFPIRTPFFTFIFKVIRSCGIFQMKQLTILHLSEGLASSSNSVELAIETKGTTDAGTAAVQRHSDRCEPLNPNRNMELKHLPCRFPNNFTISICVCSFFTTKQQLEATLFTNYWKRKVHGKPEVLAAVAKKLPEAAKAAEVLVERRVWGHSVPHKQGAKNTQSLSALHPTTHHTRCWGFFSTKNRTTNLCSATKGELRDFTFASHAIFIHHIIGTHKITTLPRRKTAVPLYPCSLGNVLQ